MQRVTLREGALLAAIVAAGAALRLVALGGADLWSDELHTLATVQLPAAEIAGERLGAGHVPLWFLLLRAWTAVAGTSDVALRLPSALVGTAALVPAWRLFRRLVTPGAALVATLVLAVHPVAVDLSREARMYPLLLLAFLVAAEAVAAARDAGRLPWRFWISAAVGACVHPTWAFGVLPLAVWAWIERRSSGPDARRALGRALAGLAASLALLALQLAAAEPQTQGLTRRAWPVEVFVFLARPWIGPRPETWFPTALLTGVAWIVVVALARRRLDPSARTFVFACVVAVPLASAAAGLAGGVPWGPARYTQFATLGAALLAGASVATISGAARRLGEQRDDGGDGTGDRADVAGADLAEGGREFAALRRLPVATLLVTLFVLAVTGIGTAPDVLHRGAAEVVRATGPEEVVWVDDEGTRLALEHYTGRTVRVGRPADEPEHWRAAVVPGEAGPSLVLLRSR